MAVSLALLLVKSQPTRPSAAVTMKHDVMPSRILTLVSSFLKFMPNPVFVSIVDVL